MIYTPLTIKAMQYAYAAHHGQQDYNGVPYILVLTLDGKDAEEKAMALVKQSVRRCRVKSKSVTKGSTEITVDVRLKNENTDFMQDVSDLPGVLSAVLVTYNGEYMT